MQMGPGIGINRRNGGGWTPARLFANGEAGFWADVSPAVCWQDVARTTPCTAAGDPVAAWKLNTSGSPIYAVTLASPVLRQTVFGQWYLEFANDYFETPVIDFSGTDKMTIVAGVRKDTDSTIGTIAELNINTGALDGTFGLFTSISAGANYAAQSRGTAFVDTSVTTFTAPITNVVTVTSDIAGDQLAMRVGDVQLNQNTGDQGSGNYTSAIVWIGRRAGTSLPLNGRIYGLIVRGAASTEQEIVSAETWMKTKAGIYDINADFYVDSINGSDANDGTSLVRAFQTISKVETEALAHGNNVRVGLAFDSLWREHLDLSTLTGTVTHGVGDPTGKLPHLCAADIADPTDFSLAPTYSNTYQITWTHSLPNEIGKNKLSVWEDGTRLKWVASVALCEAEAGTFHVSNAAIANPATIYVHPIGGTNPTSDGKTYEITSRQYGFTPGSNYDVRSVHTSKQGCHDGSFIGGANGNAAKVLSTHGVVHNQWNNIGSTHVDCIAYECEPSTWRSLNATLFVTYNDSDAAGATYRRCYAYSSSPAGSAHDGIYAHTVGGSNRLDRLTIEGCFYYGPSSSFYSSDTDYFDLIDSFAENVSGVSGSTAGVGGAGALRSTVSNFVALGGRRIFQYAENLTATDVRAYFDGTISGGAFWSTGADIQDSTFVFLQSLGDLDALLFNDTATASVFRNNVVQDSGFVVVRGVTGIQSDYNVFRQSSAASSQFFRFNGADYTFANWQTQTGGDANSVQQASNSNAIVTDAANNDWTFTSTIIDEGGRRAGSRKHIARPDWATLTAAWDAGYLGIDGTGP